MSRVSSRNASVGGNVWEGPVEKPTTPPGAGHAGANTHRRGGGGVVEAGIVERKKIAGVASSRCGRISQKRKKKQEVLATKNKKDEGGQFDKNFFASLPSGGEKKGPRKEENETARGRRCEKAKKRPS